MNAFHLYVLDHVDRNFEKNTYQSILVSAHEEWCFAWPSRCLDLDVIFGTLIGPFLIEDTSFDQNLSK